MLQKFRNKKMNRPPKHYMTPCEQCKKEEFKKECVVQIPDKFGDKPNKIHSKSSMIVLKKKQ